MCFQPRRTAEARALTGDVVEILDAASQSRERTGGRTGDLNMSMAAKRADLVASEDIVHSRIVSLASEARTGGDAVLTFRIDFARADMRPETERLLAYVERSIDQTLADCTTCGKCFEACPMTKYSEKLRDKTGAQVIAGVLGILKGEAGSPEAVEWTKLCCQSAQCIPACPEKINTMLMMRLSRITALGSTGGTPMMNDGKRDPNFFRRINAFSALQFSESEIAQWQR